MATGASSCSGWLVALDSIVTASAVPLASWPLSPTACSCCGSPGMKLWTLCGAMVKRAGCRAGGAADSDGEGSEADDEGSEADGDGSEAAAEGAADAEPAAPPLTPI